MIYVILFCVSLTGIAAFRRSAFVCFFVQPVLVLYGLLVVLRNLGITVVNRDGLIHNVLKIGLLKLCKIPFVKINWGKNLNRRQPIY